MKQVTLCVFALSVLITTAAAYADGPPAAGSAGLIARWRFDEGAGVTARDSSNGGCDCDLKGAQWAKGQARPAVELRGKGDYLEARDPAKADITGAFTISFWMNPAAWQDQYSTGVVSKKRSDAVPGYVIYGDGTTPTKITLRIAGTAGGHAMLTSASDVDEDVWQQWAVTYDPGTQVLSWYKNGNLDKRYESIAIGDTTNDTPLQIGHAHTWNGYFDGLLGQIEMYNRALSPDEIRKGYAATPASAQSASVPVRWRVITPQFPTDEVVVAGCTVQEAGAKGDG